MAEPEHAERGRPPHKPTKASRRRVAIAAGGGMSHDEIATALQLSRKTLEKHYGYELDVGAFEKRMDVMDAMHKAAMKGSVTAQKAYQALGATALQPIPPPPDADKPAAEKGLGKKEIAQQEAVTAQAGTGWDGLLPVPSTRQ